MKRYQGFCRTAISNLVQCAVRLRNNTSGISPQQVDSFELRSSQTVGNVLQCSLKANDGPPKSLVVMHGTFDAGGPMEHDHFKWLKAQDVSRIVRCILNGRHSRLPVHRQPIPGLHPTTERVIVQGLRRIRLNLVDEVSQGNLLNQCGHISHIILSTSITKHSNYNQA